MPTDAAVGLAQDIHDLAQRRFLEPEDEIQIELAIEVGVGESVAVKVELGMRLVVGEA